MLSLFITIILLFLLVYLLFQYHYKYFEKNNIHFMKPKFPFGHFKDFYFAKRSFWEIIDAYYEETVKQKIKAFGIYNLAHPILVINDPQVIKQCLIKDFDSFHDRFWTIDIKEEPLFGNLFILEGEKWRNLKTKLSPTFTSQKIRTMFDIFKERTQEVIYYLEDKEQINIEIRDLCARLFTDIIAACAFGIKCNSIQDPNSEFRQWGKKLFFPSVWQNIIEAIDLFSQKFRYFLGFKFVDPEIDYYFTQMVKDVVKFRETHNILINDFMQLMIQLKNYKPHGKSESFTIMECAAQSLSFFLSGYEVTSIIMSFAIYELVMNPKIQKRVQEEIDEIYEKSGWLTYESLQEMEYLDKIVKETLRKYPPFGYLNRTATKTITLNVGKNNEPVTLQQGLDIIIPTFSLHRDERYFAEPERFDPERFSQNISRIIPYTYLPFGDGPRKCIGKHFAMIQIKVSLAMLLYNYTFIKCEKTPEEVQFNPVYYLLQDKSGLYVRVEKR